MLNKDVKRNVDLKKKSDRWSLDQKMCLKSTCCCSFHGQKNFNNKKFLSGEHSTSSSTKTASTIEFKLCKNSSSRLLDKSVSQFF